VSDTDQWDAVCASCGPGQITQYQLDLAVGSMTGTDRSNAGVSGVGAWLSASVLRGDGVIVTRRGIAACLFPTAVHRAVPLGRGCEDLPRPPDATASSRRGNAGSLAAAPGPQGFSSP
jgi:hypothetical protein